MMTRDWKTWAAVMMVAILVVAAGGAMLSPTAGTVLAAEGETPAAGDGAPEGDGDSEVPDSVLGLLVGSGPFGWTILILSVVLVALSIQVFFDFKPEKLMPEPILVEIEEALDNGEYEQALEICQAEDVFMTRIIGAGLAKMANGFTRMEEALGEEAEAQATLLHQKLGYINLIATISPMLGLLGTVSGMVTAFGKIAMSPTAGPQELAGGIYQALTTTLLGLVVAIPGTIIFTVLRNRTVKIIMDMGVVAGEILDRFRIEE
jgi:biopolymer transport protein ExbB